MSVAVVGGGVMGLAATRVLAQRGEDVTVYEQFELGHTRGSSHGRSRIFRLSYAEEHWIKLAQRAYELWRELERETETTLLVLEGLIDAEEDPTQRLAAFDRCGVPYEELSDADARDGRVFRAAGRPHLSVGDRLGKRRELSALRTARAGSRRQGRPAPLGQADRSRYRGSAGRGGHRVGRGARPAPIPVRRPDALVLGDVHLHEHGRRGLRLRTPRPHRGRLRLQRARLQGRSGG